QDLGLRFLAERPGRVVRGDDGKLSRREALPERFPVGSRAQRRIDLDAAALRGEIVLLEEQVMHDGLAGRLYAVCAVALDKIERARMAQLVQVHPRARLEGE